MPADSASLAWAAAAALAALVALVQTARVVWYRAERASRSWAARARLERAAEGEIHAEALVRRAGYEVVARQARGGWTIRADGEPLAIGLRADLLVTREGRRYIAEVKTGSLAPRLDHAPTRRQLLEYKVAFDVDGVLLVDAERGRVVAVEMDVDREGAGDEATGTGSAWTWVVVFAAGAGVGGAVVLALIR